MLLKRVFDQYDSAVTAAIEYRTDVSSYIVDLHINLAGVLVIFSTTLVNRNAGN